MTHAGPAQISENAELLRSLFELNQPGLKQVEEKVASVFRSDAPQLSEISEYLLKLGGKRIRPLLALQIGRLFGMVTPSQQLIDAASGIELIHMATLLHDDIIDQSPTRRHKRSAFLEYGLAPSLLTGDFLLARAFGLCAHLDLFVIEATEQASVELTEGEILEGIITPNSNQTFSDYQTVAEKKTASLFALAGAVGSHLSGASPDSVTQATLFGRMAGVAFQIVDDILDVTADEDLLGKPSGTDLRQKTPSIVNILWLQSGDRRAREFFEKTSITPEEAKAAANYLKNSEIISQVKGHAMSFGELAKKALTDISDPLVLPTERNRLLALVDYTLSRCA